MGLEKGQSTAEAAPLCSFKSGDSAVEAQMAVAATAGTGEFTPEMTTGSGACTGELESWLSWDWWPEHLHTASPRDLDFSRHGGQVLRGHFPRGGLGTAEHFRTLEAAWTLYPNLRSHSVISVTSIWLKQLQTLLRFKWRAPHFSTEQCQRIWL